MTSEIKEILNNLRYTAKEHTIQVLENGGMIEHCPQQISTEMRLNSYNAKTLLDYITNLQQENERLRLDIRYWENKWENTRFANNQVKVLQDTIIKSANNTNKAMEQTEIYKSRCEKANKWVDKHTVIYTKNGISIIDWDNLSDPRKLKNILNGSDE